MRSTSCGQLNSLQDKLYIRIVIISLISLIIWSNKDVLAQTDQPSFSSLNSPSYHLSKPIKVSFSYLQKQILIKGRINGSEDLDFLFDTGSSSTIIDRRIAAEHFLDKGAQTQIAGMVGAVTANASTIQRLELGNLILNNVETRILDLTPQSKQFGKAIAGIIGSNLISKHLVTIDFGIPEIIFADIETTPRPPKATAIPFRQDQEPLISAVINGTDEQLFLIDTGASFNYLPNDIAKHYLPINVAPFKPTNKATGLDSKTLPLGTLIIDTINIGEHSVHKVSFAYPISAASPQLVTDSPLNNLSKKTDSVSIHDPRLGILGNPFWQNFIITIDYKFQRILLESNSVAQVRTDIEQAITIGDTNLVVRRDYRTAEKNYKHVLFLAERANILKDQARALGRLGNLHRVMAHELGRPEHAKTSYDYFTKAREAAVKSVSPSVEGRILADWSLLYSDNGQLQEANRTIHQALSLAPQDANVNVDCAVHLYRTRLFADMQKYVDKALSLESDNWQALWYQVKLSELFRDTQLTVSTLKRILHYYPWSKIAKDKLKVLQERMSQNEPSIILTPHVPNNLQGR